MHNPHKYIRLAGYKLFLILFLVPFALSSQCLVFENTFGTSGSTDGQLDNPWGLNFDSEGNIYIAQLGIPETVQKFSPDFNFITKIGTTGTGNGEYRDPRDVLIQDDGTIIIVDQLNSRLQYFDENGNYLSQVGGFSFPRGIAEDKFGNIYVADNGNDRVRVFTSNGTPIMNIGSSGTEEGEFDEVRDVTVDTSGKIFIPDAKNNRIQVFDKDGNFLFLFGEPGSGPGQFNLPINVEAAENGNIFVADRDNDRIQVFDNEGNFICLYENPGSEPGQLSRPIGLKIRGDSLYVVDSGNDRVQIFSIVTDDSEELPALSFYSIFYLSALIAGFCICLMVYRRF